MGNGSSCSLRRQANSGSQNQQIYQITRSKMHPLHYIKPINFEFDDPQYTAEIGLNSKTYIQEKENLNIDVQNQVNNNKTQQEQIIYKKVQVKWNKFIKMKRKNFLNDYRVIKEVGKGGFGCVYKVAMRNGNILRAAKKINKSQLKSEEHENLLVQMAIMMHMDHPNIVKLFEVYEQHNHYVMILQLCEGGELFDRIVKRKIGQRQAKSVMNQVLNALNYLHSKNIVHRDIKPQNMLFQDKTKLIKIIDFGISTKLQQNKKLSCRIGTPYYIAPEVLLKNYDEKCDIWSLGVVLYIIIYGSPPFKGENSAKVMESILRNQPFIKNPNYPSFSNLALDFLRQILNKNPRERLSAKQAQEHMWLKNDTIASNKNMLPTNEKNKVLQRITKFHFNNKLEAVVYTYIVSQLLSSQERLQLLQIFRELDTNKNGIIQIQQLKSALSSKTFEQLTEQKIRIIKDYLDTNCSGFVDYTQFLVGALDFKTKIQQKHLQQAFTYFDIDGSGEITFEEVIQFLQDQLTSREQIRELFMKVDKNGDGVVSKAQFVELLAQKKMGSK